MLTDSILGSELYYRQVTKHEFSKRFRLTNIFLGFNKESVTLLSLFVYGLYWENQYELLVD